MIIFAIIIGWQIHTHTYTLMYPKGFSHKAHKMKKREAVHLSDGQIQV